MDEFQKLITEAPTYSPIQAKSYRQIAAEYEARGEPVPPGIKMLAFREVAHLNS